MAILNREHKETTRSELPSTQLSHNPFTLRHIPFSTSPYTLSQLMPTTGQAQLQLGSFLKSFPSIRGTNRHVNSLEALASSWVPSVDFRSAVELDFRDSEQALLETSWELGARLEAV